MKLTTERLLLRDFEVEDWPAIQRWSNDDAVNRYDPNPDRHLNEAGARYVAEGYAIGTRHRQRREYYLMVERRADATPLGAVYLTVRDFVAKGGELGYRFDSVHWGQGYATEAAHVVVAYGFDEVGLHRIYAEIVRENSASVRVMEKLGFQCEGILRENRFFDDRWWDTLIFAMLGREWQQLVP